MILNKSGGATESHPVTDKWVTLNSLPLNLFSPK